MLQLPLSVAGIGEYTFPTVDRILLIVFLVHTHTVQCMYNTAALWGFV